MSDTFCGADGAPTGDGTYLCRDHADELARELAAVQGVVDDLNTTRRRAARFGSGNHGRPSTDTPLPYDERVSRVLGMLDYLLRGVALDLLGALPPDTTTAKVAASLLRHMRELRRDEGAGYAWRNITSTLRRARDLVDRPPDQVYAGPCGADLGDGMVCERDLYVPAGAREVTCPECGSVDDVEERRELMRHAVEDVLAPIPAISGLIMNHLGKQVTSSMIRNYRARKAITPRGTDRDGRELFRIGDVIDEATKRARPRKRKSA